MPRRKFILVANGIRWLEPDPLKDSATRTLHDFQMFEDQKKSLKAEGKIIGEDGYVVKK